MSGKRIERPLGEMGQATAVKPVTKLSDEERIRLLEKQVEDILRIIMVLKARAQPTKSKTQIELEAPQGLNKDGIPIGLVCIGETEKKQFPICMTVKEKSYQVGMEEYQSLSAAAEAVSGVRRSGWTFWKLPDGRTLKEALRK